MKIGFLILFIVLLLTGCDDKYYPTAYENQIHLESKYPSAEIFLVSGVTGFVVVDSDEEKQRMYYISMEYGIPFDEESEEVKSPKISVIKKLK